jgi:hypothetical protein
MVSLKGYEVRRSSQNAKSKNEATGKSKCQSATAERIVVRCRRANQ